MLWFPRDLDDYHLENDTFERERFELSELVLKLLYSCQDFSPVSVTISNPELERHHNVSQSQNRISSCFDDSSITTVRVQQMFDIAELLKWNVVVVLDEVQNVGLFLSSQDGSGGILGTSRDAGDLEHVLL